MKKQFKLKPLLVSTALLLSTNAWSGNNVDEIYVNVAFDNILWGMDQNKNESELKKTDCSTVTTCPAGIDYLVEVASVYGESQSLFTYTTDLERTTPAGTKVNGETNFTVKNGDNVLFELQTSFGDNSGATYEWVGIEQAGKSLLSMKCKGSKSNNYLVTGKKDDTDNVTISVDFTPHPVDSDPNSDHNYDGKKIRVKWDPIIVVGGGSNN